MNRRMTLALGAVVALAIFAVMGLTVSKTKPWEQAGDATAQQHANDLDAITGSLFGRMVVPFEVLGILLTAAMIGALVIARPMDAPTDESRYSHPTREQRAESDMASDVGHSLAVTARADAATTSAAHPAASPEVPE